MKHNQPDKELISSYNVTETSPIDPETVKKAMQGDKQAFSLLFMQTYRNMFLAVRRFLSRDEDIYDAMQNGYTKAYKYLPRLKTPEAFPGWLKKTMENAARDIRADIMADREVFSDNSDSIDGVADEPTADYTDASERRVDIQEVLSRLEPHHAKVLTLYYYDGMKLSEIAKMLGEPQSTVRSRFKRAKKTLVEQLKVRGIDKSLYSGSISTMIAVCLRSLIGTDILSAATAQRMLDEVIENRQTRLGAAAYKLMENQRNRSVLKAASMLMVLTVGVTCITVALLNGLPWKWIPALGEAKPPANNADVPAQTDRSNLSDLTRPTDSDSTGNPNEPEQTSNESYNTDTAEPRPSNSDTDPKQTTDEVTPSDPDHAESTPPGDITEPDPPEPEPSEPTAPEGPKEPEQTTAEIPTTTEPKVTEPIPTEPDFISDYKPGYANTTGNTANNVGINPGYVAKQADWLYFAEGSNHHLLFKMKTDGSQKQFLAENSYGFQYINVIGDWIYYCGNGIWRMRTDGSNRELVSSMTAEHLIVIGNTGYFSVKTSSYSIYKIDLSTDKIQVVERNVPTGFFLVYENQMFHFREREGSQLYVTDLKTSKDLYSMKISYFSFLIGFNRIYYQDNYENLYSLNYTDPNATAQTVGAALHFDPLFISPYQGGLIGEKYNYDSFSKPRLITTTGKIASWKSSEKLSMTSGFYTFDDDSNDDYVFFFGSDMTLCRALADGTELVSFS